MSGPATLYPVWLKNQTWRENLAKKAAHKSLDIPEDDMEIKVDKSGVGAGALIGVALAAGVPVAVLALAMLLKGGTTPATSAPGPADSNYTVRFFDAQGRPIEVPHISQRPKSTEPAK